MIEDINEIRAGIKSGKFVNEASVSIGIVQRILKALNWPVYNPDIVSPEYPCEGKRVDFALCHPISKPIVFIEVKQIGKSDGADKQLFEYSFHYGVPLSILTDGQEWHFFLPGEQGDYGERRVYMLDILEREPEESVKRLNRYLNYNAICTGQAIELARSDYRDVTKKREIQASFPEAFKKLIDEGDELLIELVADKVESICGYKPDPDAVSTFLTDNIQVISSRSTSIKTPHKPPRVARNNKIETTKRSQAEFPSIGFILNDQVIQAKNAKDVFIKVFMALDNRDENFFERFASLPKHGRTRRYLSQLKNELYSNRPDLVRDYSFEIKPGWWIGTNVGVKQIIRILEMACNVADLRFGSDLKTNLGV